MPTLSRSLDQHLNGRHIGNQWKVCRAGHLGSSPEFALKDSQTYVSLVRKIVL